MSTPVTNMLQLFSPGDTIYGFCNGFFGRDDYETKVCVSVHRKYAVFEYESGFSQGFAIALNYDDRFALEPEMIAKWKQEQTD